MTPNKPLHALPGIVMIIPFVKYRHPDVIQKAVRLLKSFDIPQVSIDISTQVERLLGKRSAEKDPFIPKPKPRWIR